MSHESNLPKKLHVVAPPSASWRDELDRLPPKERFLRQTYNRFIASEFWLDLVEQADDDYRAMVASIAARYRRLGNVTTKQLSVLEVAARKQQKIIPYPVYLTVVPSDTPDSSSQK